MTSHLVGLLLDQAEGVEYETPGTPLNDELSAKFNNVYDACRRIAIKRDELLEVVNQMDAMIAARKEALLDAIKQELSSTDQGREWRVVRDKATGRVLVQYARDPASVRVRPPTWADELRQRIEEQRDA